jgi:hypothetical protein
MFYNVNGELQVSSLNITATENEERNGKDLNNLKHRRSVVQCLLLKASLTVIVDRNSMEIF